MNSIRFTSSDSQGNLFAAAVRKNVNQYFADNNISTKGNFGVVIQTIAMLLLYIAPFVLILTVTMSAWMAILMTVLMAIGMAGVGMCVMHDAVHGAYSQKPWVNQLFGASIYLLGSNLLNWKIQHNVLHHTFTNIEGHDHDIDSGGFVRLSEHAPLLKFHKYQHFHAFFFYGMLTLSKLVLDYKQLTDFNKAGIIKQGTFNPTKEYSKLFIVKALYLFVTIGLPLLFTPFTWWQVLIGFFIMHFIGGLI